MEKRIAESGKTHGDKRIGSCHNEGQTGQRDPECCRPVVVANG
jgi:hypothetical protein